LHCWLLRAGDVTFDGCTGKFFKCHDPFKGYRLPKDIWYRRFPLSHADIWDLLAGQGMICDHMSVFYVE